MTPTEKEAPASTREPAPEPDSAARAERFDVFVVNAKDDRDWVEGFLLAGLRDAGVRYLDESQFPLGPPELKLFADGVERSDRILLVVTPAFLTDSRVEFVKWLALHFGDEQSTWPVVSLIREPVERLPPELGLAEHLDMTSEEDWEQGLQRIVENLHRQLPDRTRRPHCPYPGLLPYTGEEEERFPFCGRDAEIDEVLECLRVHPVLAVIGTSGSGKSSLLHAGVRPRLERDHEVVSVRPGRTPTANLAAAVSRTRESSRPVVLIVDQFEELFTLSHLRGSAESEVMSFCEELITLFADRASDGLRCIIAIRADYYPQLMTCPLWERIRDHRFELLPLRGDQLRRAIQEPASAVGVHVEAALVEALVRDSEGEPGSLPLVQETLVSLWGHLRRRYLPLSAYDALILPGRAYGEPPRTGLQVALARHAEATVSSLDEADRVTARRIFLRLVQLMDGREDVRRPQRRRELESMDSSSESVDRVLQRLIDARLVTPTADEATEDPRETLLDLAHEAIISGWPSLRAWITERRAAEVFRRKLEASASEWVRLGRGDGGLLDEVELTEARSWLDGPDASELGVSQDVVDLVASSRSTLETARARKARQDRMFRILSAALAVLLVAAGVSALIAVGQRNEAEEGRLAARSGQLGLSAEGLPPEQLDRALLLALEGLALRRTPLTVGGILAALNSNPRVVRLLHADEPQLAVAVTGDVGTGVTGLAGVTGVTGLTGVTGGQDGVVRVWDLGAGGPARRLAALDGEVRSIALSPDGRTVAASSSRGAVGLWELATGNRVPWTRSSAPPGEAEHQGSVRSIAFSADGRSLATAGQDGVVIVREASTGRVEHVFEGYRDWLNAVTFTPDGTLLVAAGGRTEGRSVDERILLWDVRAGGLHAELTGHDEAVRALSVSPDGRTFASADAEGIIKVWSLPEGRMLRRLDGHQDRIFGLSFSPDGTLLASAGRDHTVRLWDPATGEPAMDPLRAHGDSVRGLAFASSGQVLSVGNDGRLVLWHAGPEERARLALPLADQPGTTRAVAADPTRALVATGDDTGRVVVRRAGDGQPTGVAVDTGGPVSGVALGPGSLLVTANYDGHLRVWDTSTGAPRTPGTQTGEGSLVVAVSADGRTIATGGDKNIIRLWDQDLQQKAELVGHRNWVRALAFMPRGQGQVGGLEADQGADQGADQDTGQGEVLVSAGADGMAFVWESLRTAAQPRALGQRSSLMEALAISPDGRTIATGNAEGQVILWDAAGSDATPARRPRLAGHEGKVTGIAYSPSGDWIVTADVGGTVRLWAAESGLEPWGELGRIGEVSGLVAVSDQQVFSVGAGGPARWVLDERQWRQIACTAAGRNLRPEEAARYGFPQPPLTCTGGAP
ncbi:TIR domain-containing protein [Intrasporangium sp.]|uniref:nSTAND1 domain-containing NTPase n=1 Tax=Intrasporangium sp. TaxID=1925024 RepID=UPI00293A282A|nr:TIR domain-containing protein [Intrasporangium sp.]MDV3222448.1 TIR domain-containing protein [Intrasporangium sp.]